MAIICQEITLVSKEFCNRDYRLIFIDSRNHGRSSRQSVKMTFEQMAAVFGGNFAIFEYQEGLICRS